MEAQRIGGWNDGPSLGGEEEDQEGRKKWDVTARSLAERVVWLQVSHTDIILMEAYGAQRPTDKSRSRGLSVFDPALASPPTHTAGAVARSGSSAPALGSPRVTRNLCSHSEMEEATERKDEEEVLEEELGYDIDLKRTSSVRDKKTKHKKTTTGAERSGRLKRMIIVRFSTKQSRAAPTELENVTGMECSRSQVRRVTISCSRAFIWKLGDVTYVCTVLCYHKVSVLSNRGCPGCAVNSTIAISDSAACQVGCSAQHEVTQVIDAPGPRVKEWQHGLQRLHATAEQLPCLPAKFLSGCLSQVIESQQGVDEAVEDKGTGHLVRSYCFEGSVEVNLFLSEEVGSHQGGHGLALSHGRIPAGLQGPETFAQFTSDHDGPSASLVLVAHQPVAGGEESGHVGSGGDSDVVDKATPILGVGQTDALPEVGDQVPCQSGPAGPRPDSICDFMIFEGDELRAGHVVDGEGRALLSCLKDHGYAAVGGELDVQAEDEVFGVPQLEGHTF
ncbi:hypothetical protein INR49_029148 [Caranx melampygus]|nr:hypothetical protein INR49_029148 [Caranx melampygus]